jgi:hypothetical protein
MSIDDAAPQKAGATGREAQTALDDFAGSSATSERKRERLAFNPTENCCRNCGREIGGQTARVIGDGDGTVPGCIGCSDAWEPSGFRFATTTALVAAIRRGDLSLEGDR